LGSYYSSPVSNISGVNSTLSSITVGSAGVYLFICLLTGNLSAFPSSGAFSIGISTSAANIGYTNAYQPGTIGIPFTYLIPCTANQTISLTCYFVSFGGNTASINTSQSTFQAVRIA